MSLKAPSRRALLTATVTLALGSTLPTGKEAAKAGWWPRFQGAAASAIPTIAPKTVAQGGTYNGTPSSGYSSNDLTYLTNAVGTPIPDRVQYGGSFAATATTAPKIAPIFHVVNLESRDTMVTGTKCRIQFANHAAGTNGLDNGRVDVYCEGNIVPLTNVTPGSFSAWGGVNRSHPMLEIDVLSPDPINGGVVEIYGVSVPSSDMQLAGMVPRGVGALRIYFKPLGFDKVLTVDASQPADSTNLRFQKASDALNYVADQGSAWDGYFVNIRHLQSGASIDFYAETFRDNVSTMNTRRGGVQIDGGGTLVMGSAFGLSAYATSSTTDPKNVVKPFNFKFTGLKVVNAKCDISRCGAFHRAGAETRYYSWKNIEFYGAGMFYLGGIDGLGMYDNPKVFWSGPNAYTSCMFRDARAGDMGAWHMVGCKLLRWIGDQNQPASDTLGANASKASPVLFLMNDSYDANGTPLTDADATLQLSYSGAAGDVATWSITGTHASSSRAISLLVNGNVKATYAATLVTNGVDVATARNNGKIVSMSDLAAAINAQTGTTGWSAATLGAPAMYDKLQIAYMVGFSQGFFNLPPANNFSADVTVNPYITAVLALHVDAFQFGAGFNDNCLVGGYYAIRGNYNTLTAGNLLKANCAYINVAIDLQRDDAGSSSHNDNGSVAGSTYHFVIAHSTFPTGTVMGDSSSNLMDSFCRFLNSYSGNLGFGTSLSSQAQIRNNVQWWGTAPENTNPPHPAADASNKLIQTGVNPQVPAYYNIVDFPKMMEGTSPNFVDHGVTYTMSKTKGTWDKPDFTPAANGNLRKAAFMAPPCVPFDIEGRPRNPVLDWVGAVGMAAAA